MKLVDPEFITSPDRPRPRDGKHYREHGQSRPGGQATSALFPEFSIDVTELFAAGKQAQ